MVILGGSLTNWPATREPKTNKLLLRPIELSEAMFSLETEDMFAAMIEDLKQWITGLFAKQAVPETGETTGEPPELSLQGAVTMPEETITAPVELTADQTAQLEALVNERADLRFQEMVEREQRKNRILDFTRTVTGRGLAVQGEDLTAFLSSLAPDQLTSAEAIFTKISETGSVDFSEKGHSKVLTGAQPLPDALKPSLRAWLDANLSMQSFFETNAVELGSISDYNLAEFEPKETK